MKKNLMFSLIMFILGSCEQADEKLSKQLNDQVMSLHDKLMPQTEQIQQLKTTLDRLTQGKDSVHVKKIIAALDKADESMMDWMHHFSVDSLSKMEVKNQIIYLSQQLDALRGLENTTDSSIYAAKKYSHP